MSVPYESVATDDTSSVERRHSGRDVFGDVELSSSVALRREGSIHVEDGVNLLTGAERGDGDGMDGSGSGEDRGHDKHLSSDVQTFINTLISFVGAGLLGIPYAFRQGGLFLSLGVMCGVGLISTYCMWLLLRCKYHLAAKSAVTYGAICEHALGRFGLLLVEGSLVITQTGFSTAYLVFISRNINQLFSLSKGPVVMACMPGLVVLCLMRHLKYLAPFSLLAEVVNMVGLAVVYVNDFEFYELNHEQISMGHLPALPFVFGVAVYCYEGMGMVLPIENSMLNKKRFMPVLCLVMFLFTSMCATTGAFGYLAFGDETQDIILLNMGVTVYSKMVKISFCVGLYFTFPIMMTPVWEVLELKFLSPQAPSFERRRDLVRTSLVALTGLVACIVPNFGLFISLIGSSCCSLLAFILPPLCFDRLVSAPAAAAAAGAGGEGEKRTASPGTSHASLVDAAAAGTSPAGGGSMGAEGEGGGGGGGGVSRRWWWLRRASHVWRDGGRAQRLAHMLIMVGGLLAAAVGTADTLAKIVVVAGGGEHASAAQAQADDGGG